MSDDHSASRYSTQQSFLLHADNTPVNAERWRKLNAPEPLPFPSTGDVPAFDDGDNYFTFNEGDHKTFSNDEFSAMLKEFGLDAALAGAENPHTFGTTPNSLSSMGVPNPPALYSSAGVSLPSGNRFTHPRSEQGRFQPTPHPAPAHFDASVPSASTPAQSPPVLAVMPGFFVILDAHNSPTLPGAPGPGYFQPVSDPVAFNVWLSSDLQGGIPSRPYPAPPYYPQPTQGHPSSGAPQYMHPAPDLASGMEGLYQANQRGYTSGSSHRSQVSNAPLDRARRTSPQLEQPIASTFSHAASQHSPAATPAVIVPHRPGEPSKPLDAVKSRPRRGARHPRTPLPGEYTFALEMPGLQPPTYFGSSTATSGAAHACPYAPQSRQRRERKRQLSDEQDWDSDMDLAAQRKKARGDAT